MAAPKYIAIAGNIGAGKTELTEFLCTRYGLSPFFEPNDDNPYLADFYGDMERWALHSQMFFLLRRFRIHKDIVQDRTIYEDAEIFAAHLHKKGQISERDWEMYQDLYTTLRREIRPPDLMIYLRCPVPVLVKRIKGRGRSFEQKIPRAYLASLHELYEGWFARYDASETIVVDTDRVDYVEHLFDRHDLLETIRSRLGR